MLIIRESTILYTNEQPTFPRDTLSIRVITILGTWKPHCTMLSVSDNVMSFMVMSCGYFSARLSYFLLGNATVWSYFEECSSILQQLVML